jgi:cytochrome c oxidase subunit 3
MNLVMNDIERQEIKSKAYKPMLMIAIVSMVMLFAGLTSAYIVRQAEGNWLSFELPSAFYTSTGVILLSSLTMNWALASAKKDHKKNIKTAMALTLILGLLFVISQFAGWNHLVKQNVFFAGPSSNASGSFLYALTGLHLAHLFGGLIYVSIVLSRALNEKYSSKNFLGLQLCSIYWHFLDILWIYLFFFLLFIR